MRKVRILEHLKELDLKMIQEQTNLRLEEKWTASSKLIYLRGKVRLLIDEIEEDLDQDLEHVEKHYLTEGV